MMSFISGGTDHGGIGHQKGMFGGCPAPGPRYLWARGTELQKRVNAGGKGLLPRSIREAEAMLQDDRLTAEEYRFSNGPIWSPSLKDGDLCGLYITGGAGYGDPLERDPERGVGDLEMGVVTPKYLRQVYGIVVEETRAEDAPTAWTPDNAATAKARDVIRRERLEASIPFAEWWASERRAAIAHRCGSRRRRDAHEQARRRQRAAGTLLVERLQVGEEVALDRIVIGNGIDLQHRPVAEQGPRVVLLCPYEDQTPALLRSLRKSA